MSAPHLEVYPDKGGEVRWRLVAGNGEIVIPPEGHRDQTDAARAMRRAHTLLGEALAAGAIETRDA